MAPKPQFPSPDDRFGKLTFVRLVDAIGSCRVIKMKALFRCDCGVEKVMLMNKVRYGDTASCGCLSYQPKQGAGRKPRHGDSLRGQVTREYRIWCSMHTRCTNPKANRWKHYGGRGIKVCERWETSYEAFLQDMGHAPSPKHSIDRINNDGNYEPGNCRWATSREQRGNHS